VIRALNRALADGTYSLTLSAGLSRQMYCVRLSDGTHAEIFSMLNCGGRIAAPGLDKIMLSKSSDPVSLAKITAVDGLRVGKTGYAPDTVQLNTYNDGFGNVKITKIDIEYRVDSLLSLMTQDEKIGQLMQPAGTTQDIARTALLVRIQGRRQRRP